MDKQYILNLLSDFISLQSVSADPKKFDQILQAVNFLQKKLSSLGFEVELLTKEKTPPLIIAKKILNLQAKTIAIYGHYDVQPEDPLNEWQTQPFELTVKNGKLFGRGVADNKGHVIQNITAIESLINNNKLKNNIIFIIEGEEESGSANFEEFIKQAQGTLSKADVFYVTDMNAYGKNRPQIFYGLRGLIYFELKLTIGNRDLHSGVYGNRVYNPINVLTDLVSKIKDIHTGKVLIPHFYDKVRQPTKEELQLLAKTKKEEAIEKDESQTFALTGVEGIPDYLSAQIYPSFDCHGIIAGYIGKGAKTVIPKEATVKFSFRLIEHQDPKEVEQLVRTFVKDNLPKGVAYDLQMLSADVAFYTDIKNAEVDHAAVIMSEHFGNETIYNRSGGSVPAAEFLSRLYKKPVILTGFTLPDDNIHAPNENFDEEMFWKGIEVLKKLYR